MLYKISNNIFGFDEELSFFIKLYNKNCLPNALLFQGLEGIGKYTFVLHLINSLINNKYNSEIEDSLKKNPDILIIKKNESSNEFKIEEIKKIIDFCKYKSFDIKSKFIVIKSTNSLNKNSVNALLKLTEEVKENVYFFFTSNFMFENSKTLESRFFVKKLFLKKKFYNQIISNYFREMNIQNDSFENTIKDTPGNYLRKYFFSLDPNFEKLKKNNIDLFYKIISEKIVNKFNNDHLKILKKMKLNLVLKNDINKILSAL
tara:strand:+ start:3400 stop:4179 length:780 start_codon:yes stop_codon:yes gene_type:complete